MAHFAEIDSSNIVVRVLVVPDSEQHRGQQFLANDLGLGGTWVQTSFNGTIRKQFAGIGYEYYPGADVFVAIKPYPSWILDVNHDWQAPVPMPLTPCIWDEQLLSWVAV